MSADPVAVSTRFGWGMVHDVRVVEGGFTHDVRRYSTDVGDFAVKVLAPGTERRPVEAAITVERAALAAGFPAPEIVTDPDGEVLVDVDAHLVRAHRWVDAPSLPSEAAPLETAASVAGLLVRLHDLDVPLPDGTEVRPGEERPLGGDAWAALLDDADRTFGWVAALSEALPALDRLGRAVRDAPPPTSPVATHRDLFGRNVLAAPSGPVVCDWDTAGRWDRHEEMATAAVEWAGGIVGPVEPSVFTAFLRAAVAAGAEPPPADRSVFTGFWAKQLGWLERHLRAAVAEPPDPVALHRLPWLAGRFVRQAGEVDRWVDLLGTAVGSEGATPYAGAP